MKNNKTFEQVLSELDAMITADFIKFQQDLRILSIRENMDKVFENSENIINLADESEYHPIHLKDESRINHRNEDKVTPRTDNF
tara:strand:+ start:245 stop:496 length:252 start_codon:yes stop_codon:yes gene_type:complete